MPTRHNFLPILVSEASKVTTQNASDTQVMPETASTSSSTDYGYLEEAAITAEPLLLSEADEAPAQLTLANEQVMPGMDFTSYLPEHDYLEETDITTRPILVSETDEAPLQLALADEVMPEMSLSSSSTDNGYLEEADEGETITLDTK
ncbi:hypothetical protein K4K57_009188 [Colletotrichum sp. SAR 10_99]|nr:hypothetical protein K4K55_003824 [Colletotrichum sp. SAR 10_96]KAJ5009207.1 hypothetical protein K4K57_009188 [Colletotrichum sp. SAR 10_99]